METSIAIESLVVPAQGFHTIASDIAEVLATYIHDHAGYTSLLTSSQK